MNKLTVTKHFAAPPEQVFAAATDFAHAAQTISAIRKMEMLTEGPVGLGTRFRETRVMFGKEATEVMEVSEWNPPTGYVLGAESHGSRYRSEYVLTPSGGGTDLAMTFEAVPLTTFAKLMSFLMKPMLKSAMKMVAKDLDDLEASLGAAAASSA